MKLEINIFLLGFVPFEKATFESFFKLVGRRETLYRVVTEVAQAKILIVNGDNPAAVQFAQTSSSGAQKAIYVGARDAAGNWPNAPRPIKLTAVLGLMDLLVKNEASKNTLSPPVQKSDASTLFPLVAGPAFARRPPLVPSATGTATANAAVTVRKNAVRQGTGAKVSSGFAASTFMGIGVSPRQQSTSEHFDDILIVDDSDVALKFMQSRLTRYGFRCHAARSGEEALTYISTKSYKFVFLDVMMDGLDGYQTCRAIKQQKHPSVRPPIVVMLTSRGGSIDKIRGGLAGCDAFLTKPLNEVALLKILAKHDEQVERSFRDTNYGGGSSLMPAVPR